MNEAGLPAARPLADTGQPVSATRDDAMQKEGIMRHLGRWEEYLLFIVMMAMLIILGAQVICRYFFSFSFSWAEQGARIGFVHTGADDTERADAPIVTSLLSAPPDNVAICFSGLITSMSASTWILAAVTSPGPFMSM